MSSCHYWIPTAQCFRQASQPIADTAAGFVREAATLLTLWLQLFFCAAHQSQCSADSSVIVKILCGLQSWLINHSSMASQLFHSQQQSVCCCCTTVVLLFLSSYRLKCIRRLFSFGESSPAITVLLSIYPVYKFSRSQPNKLYSFVLGNIKKGFQCTDFSEIQCIQSKHVLVMVCLRPKS